MKAMVWAVALTVLAGCGDASEPAPESPEQVQDRGGKADSGRWSAGGEVEPLNHAAADMIIYEVQARSANACHLTETPGCAELLAPEFVYEGDGCGELDELQAVRKSTLDDMRAVSASPHRERGITLQYIDEVVGANTVWLMPIYPHNSAFNLPSACDDLGSPYAVRDFYHVRGSLSDACVRDGRDEWSQKPCWGDDALDALVTDARGRGMNLMLDLAFNHLGHEYHFYDYVGASPVRELVKEGARMWDFEATFDEALIHPEILDSARELPAGAADDVATLCGRGLEDELEVVRRHLMWREGFDWERAAMDCDRPATLENQLPGFYLGADAKRPSKGVGDNFTNDWRDVKFLFNKDTAAHAWEFARTREFAFRVVNYYLSRGVTAFRMDHANGLTEDEWRYIFRKAEFYQRKRGLPEPVFMSESFHDIGELNRVFDVLTEGYHHDISFGRRNASDLEASLFHDRAERLGDISYVLLNLETHDEGRLLAAETGFDIWRGATFYALASASRGTPMIQVGQEWGEPIDLGFRRSDYLRGRYPGEPTFNPNGDALTALYGSINRARLAPENVALRHGKNHFLRRPDGTPEQQLFAMAKYMPDCSNTVLTFHRLWVDDIATTYAVTDELAGKICLKDDAQYRLVDVFTGRDVWAQHPAGRSGRDIRRDGVHVRLDLATSFQWLRLEQK